MKQNTPEWLEFRKNKVGASDAPAIMEVDPFATPYQKWMEKMDLAPPKVTNGAMQRGHDLEPIARDQAEQLIGCSLTPKVKLHPSLPWMFSSLDGVSEDKKLIVEIKCPDKETHAMAESGCIPPKYFPQLQHQLETCELEMSYYFSFNGTAGVLVKVFRDAAFIKKMIEKEKQFWDWMQNLEIPPLCDRDFETHDDSEWETQALQYIGILADIKSLERQQEVARQNLIRLSNNRNAQGAGVKVAKITMRGKVDYKSIPELNSIDLEKYRKKSSESWRILTSK